MSRLCSGQHAFDVPYESCIVQMSLKVVASEVVSSLPLNDLKKGVAKLARHIAESGLSFIRWKDGTCIEAPELPGLQEDDEPFQYTWSFWHMQSCLISVMEASKKWGHAMCLALIQRLLASTEMKLNNINISRHSLASDIIPSI